MDSLFGDDGDEERLQGKWRTELEEACMLLNELHSMVAERTALLSKGADAAKLSAQTRRKLSTMEGFVSSLDRLLAQLRPALTEKEAMRRRDEVGRLKRDCASLEHILRSEGRPGGAAAAGRAAGGSRAFGGDGGDPEVAHRSYENMRTAELPTQQLAALQRTMLCEQDAQLDALSKTVSNLRSISQGINQEIHLQNSMLETLEHNMDKSSNKLAGAEKKITNIDEQSVCVIC